VEKVEVSIDTVASHEEALPRGGTRKAVRVLGTVENTGRRDVRSVGLEVVLKTEDGRAVGLAQEDFPEYGQEALAGGQTAKFQVEIEPLSDEWVADLTEARVRNVRFSQR
jgi:hypothetical protein